jgi:antitoxin (DNA-binding transcriptional repressor) of toxin-antitoxin stability system
MIEKIVSLRELRENTGTYISEVGKGRSFVVMKKSKPIFRLSPIDEESVWEEVIDFTKLRRGGVPLDELLTRLEKTQK